MSLRALIVDDEPLARERIRTLLAGEPDVEVVGECGDGRAALVAIRERSPDLVFLDVQMPELDGFEVLAEAGDGRPPAVIFVTAYDRYALRAFEVHALDYLLKPFDRERFRGAVERARADLAGERGGERQRRLWALLETLARREGYRERFVVRSAGRVQFVRAEEVDRIEAQSNYVLLHCGQNGHLLRETMKALEPQLDPRRFLRVHRSHIVNLDRVRQLEPRGHGEYLITLDDGSEVVSGRTYAAALQRLLGADA